MNRQETLEIYIRKILDIQDEALTESDLQAVAYELGLTPEDYAELQAECEDHLTRGQGFLKHENWDDAIDEFQQAKALNPLREDIWMALASAHRARFQAQQSAEDREKANSYARKCLKRNPQHEAALALISSLREPIKPRKVRTGLVLAAVIILGLLPMYWLIEEEQATHKGEIALTPAERSPASPQPDGLKATRFDQLPVPIVFYPDKSGALTLIPRVSNINAYPESHTYRLQALVKVQQNELQALRLGIEMVLSDGTRWFETEYKVHDQGLPGARIDDLLPIGMAKHMQLPKPDRVEEVRIRVLHIGWGQEVAEYPVSKLQAVTWAEPRPAQMDLKVRVREYRFSSYSNRHYVRYAYEVSNSGQIPFSSLKLQSRWFDAEGQLLETCDSWVVGPTGPILPPGETRIVGRTCGMKQASPDQLARMEVVVSHARFPKP